MTHDTLGTILLVCTSHSELGQTGNQTGIWMEELTAPYFVFKEAGYDIDIASPTGGRVPVDPGSQEKNMQGPSVAMFEADQEACLKLSKTIALGDISDSEKYTAIFLVGGHGTMWDFPQNAELGRLLSTAIARKNIVGAVCHGVAGLLNNAVSSEYAGKSVAGFSNEEEAAAGLTEVVPFLLESKLQEAGFKYNSAKAFTSHVETDGLLVTGQNPMSSHDVAKSMLDLISNV